MMVYKNEDGYLISVGVWAGIYVFIIIFIIVIIIVRQNNFSF